MSVSGGPALQEYYFTSISKGYYFHQRGMFIDEEEKIAYPKNNKLKKTPHSITFQCMGRGLGHLAAKNWEPNQNFENSVNFDENFQI